MNVDKNQAAILFNEDGTSELILPDPDENGNIMMTDTVQIAIATSMVMKTKEFREKFDEAMISVRGYVASCEDSDCGGCPSGGSCG